MTPAEKRALNAVLNGKVTRIYRANGNVLRGPKGVSSATLWRLDQQKLITDSADVRGVLERYCRQVLTAKGQRILDKN